VTAKTEHFSIHASVVFQLGENLVTDATQALLELVKNSYDADAEWCKVSIDTTTATSGGTGLITVEDNGVGMAEEAIRRGWLTISDSLKKEFKRNKRVTDKGRTPLGDKGLGRLGTQRLGSQVQIVTSTGDGTERKVVINWDAFHEGILLENVPVEYTETRSSATQGTKLSVLGLRDLETWKTAGRDSIRKNLSQVISPYKGVERFEVYAKFDGEPLDLYEIGTKLRNTAILTYSLRFAKNPETDIEELSIRGKVSLDYVRPDKGKKEKLLFEDMVQSDGGAAYFKYLKARKSEAARFDFTRLAGRWWAEFGIRRSLDEFTTIESIDGVIASPGPFEGEIDSYALSQEMQAKQDVFTEGSDYRALIRALSGIRVYRDGFGIRLSQDWLQLGSQWTSGTSYYGLRPENTMGFIAISARDNYCLEEKTDREGFTDNVYYRNFNLMLKFFVDYAREAQEFLRRGWNDFKSAKVREPLDISEEQTPEDITSSVRSALSRAVTYRLDLSQASLKLRNAAKDAEAIRLLNAKATLSEQEKTERHTLYSRIESTISEIPQLLSKVDEYLQDLTKAERMSDLVSQQLETLREQMQQMHEIVAIGLTAEALTHQVKTLALDLSERNDKILNYLRGSGPRDSRLISYAEHVRSVVGNLRKEISYLAPSLQYVRETREDVPLHLFVNELFKHHLSAFSAERISMRLNTPRATDFVVRVNRGKLTQICENLLLNSEYWLKEDMRLRLVPHGQITIETKRPFVYVFDNGRGVDPKLEDIIFEPFVTGKPRGIGRGLGLFIVQQLLASEGCSINLAEERNKDGRRFRFELNLGGMLLG
jgi:signal transduction histidine kinase